MDFEQVTASPHVLQFMSDYMFVHSKLSNEGINNTVSTDVGDADLALSIVNDAYNHNRADQKSKQQPAPEQLEHTDGLVESFEVVPLEDVKRELGL